MKKLLAILGMITCMVGLCACGQQEKFEAPLSDAELLQVGETTIEQMDIIVSQGASAIEQYAADPIVYSGLIGWQNALKDIGQFEGTNGGTVSVSEDAIVISINIAGSDHDAVVDVSFDGAMTYRTGITTNVTYSFKEIMGKAVMNTVIGMGTVFVVLIFISLIISCFGLFSKMDGKKQKNEDAVSANAMADPVVSQIAQKEELADDTELVAVIAAAIAAYEGSGSTDGFVVRSIRKSNKSKWQNA